MSDPSELKPNQLRAIESLADGGFMADAAKAAGVSERQLWRWRQTPEFNTALHAATAEVFDDALRVLAAGMRGAAQYLVDAATEYQAADPAQTVAARAVLQLAPAMREHTSMAARLDALEAAQAAADRPRGS